MNNSNNSDNNSSEDIKGSRFWRSLKELGSDSEINETKANEFMQGVTDDFDIKQLAGVSRRKFLALLSASVSFAAASCSNYKDKGEIVPYNKKPEEITPGVANYYASTCTGCSNACGIIIKTREGRPIKVDGNPQHPVNMGKICAIGQASVLNLYDPNRLRKPIKISGGSSSEIPWSNVDDLMIKALTEAQNSNKKIAIITGKIVSPTESKLLNEFKAKYPNTLFYSYEFFNDDIRINAWKKVYGSGLPPLINWDMANVVVSLEGDFLGHEGHSIENIRLFSSKRDGYNKKEFNRFYSVEGAMSLTGMNADYRMRLRPDAQLEFVLNLLNEINNRLNKPLKVNGNYSLHSFAKQHGLSEKTVDLLVNDLLSNRGSAIVYAGSKLPEEVHVAVNALNEILGNAKLYNKEQQIAFSSSSDMQQWEDLINNMKNGNVSIVIHYDTNPVYHLPKDYGYESALRKVPLSVSLTEQENETSSLCTYTLPINHALESWGDYNIRTGIYSLQQPVIYPLYTTRQKEAALMVWIAGNKAAFKDNMYHEYLMSNWEKGLFQSMNMPVDFKTFWFTSLENGVVHNTKAGLEGIQQGAFNRSAVAALSSKQQSNGFILYIKHNYNLGDGKYANNGWLQELPHPVSKVVWDNYAAISPGTAKELNVDTNDKIEITIGNRKQQFPVFIQPGTADKVIVVEAGYGRSKAGDVGTDIGVNANVLLTKDLQLAPFLFNNIAVQKSHGSYKLVTTQEMHSLDETRVKDMHLKRGIIRQGTVQEFKENPRFLEKEKREQQSVNKDVQYKTVKWGMGIDLNKCIGCNACVVACDVENNIPVVGKDQVDRGRIMHWFRVDRYYSGTPEDPVVYNQPMLCQHCDTAPCENVCPVAATSHSPDGLNQMAYNRCVGTRYCSNNCPYKVRRFNFFNFRDHFADGYYQQEPIELVYNPEVTVRSRGVMEKCTFCVQRIMLAREIAIEENRPLKGTDVETACQQACPSRAIVFGDVNDPESIVSKHRVHELGYHVLAEINTRPNITYLAKLRNTLPEDKA